MMRERGSDREINKEWEGEREMNAKTWKDRDTERYTLMHIHKRDT